VPCIVRTRLAEKLIKRRIIQWLGHESPVLIDFGTGLPARPVYTTGRTA